MALSTRYGLNLLAIGIVLTLATAAEAQNAITDAFEYGEPVIQEDAPATQYNAYPEGDFYQQLSAAGGQGCGPGGCSNDGWGCGGSPYRNGPGKCDNYRTGPVWRVELDGLFLDREETNLGDFATAIGTTLGGANQFENFEHGGGVRLTATGHWPQMRGYEMSIGYIGVEEWNASVVGPITAVGAPPVGSVALSQQRLATYQSSMHSMEINWQRLTSSYYKPYAGVRYILFDEDIADVTGQFPTAPLAIGETSIANTTRYLVGVENNLVGFQLGLKRDLWKVRRKLYFQGFVNSGVYCNFINRSETLRSTTTTTEVLDDDPGTTDVDETGQVDMFTSSTGTRVKSERVNAAFVGEAALELVWKINNCCALRSGYEVLYIDGVEFGDDTYFGAVERESILIHGLFCGLEYRR